MAAVNILAWIIVGGIAGWLAGLAVHRTGLGIIGDVIVGIVGALIGGFTLSLLLPGTFGFSGFNLGSLMVAFIGAVILLFIVKLLRRENFEPPWGRTAKPWASGNPVYITSDPNRGNWVYITSDPNRGNWVYVVNPDALPPQYR